MLAATCLASQNDRASSELCDAFKTDCVSSKLTRFIIKDASDRLPNPVPPKPHFSMWWTLIARKAYQAAKQHRATLERRNFVMKQQNNLNEAMELT